MLENWFRNSSCQTTGTETRNTVVVEKLRSASLVLGYTMVNNYSLWDFCPTYDEQWWSVAVTKSSIHCCQQLVTVLSVRQHLLSRLCNKTAWKLLDVPEFGVILSGDGISMVSLKTNCLKVFRWVKWPQSHSRSLVTGQVTMENE